MYNQDQVRRDQAAEAKRRTLTANIKPQAKKPFIAKGHDAILKNMQDSGEQISVHLISTEFPVVGRLVARDKFTVTVQFPDGLRRTYYKHAIESFGDIEKVQ